MEKIINDMRFAEYYALLIEWNAKFNLTAITDENEVYVKHFLDSYIAAPFFKSGATVLDIGSGAGFPGIPLKLVRDDLTVTLVDSNNKKVTFMTEVINRLGLTGITARHCRAEDIKDRGAFDYVVSRAVAKVGILAEYSLPFIRMGGQAIFYKSDKVDEELKEAETAFKILGGKLNSVQKIQLTPDIIRTLVIVDKTSSTPAKYPRSGNKPRLQPL